MSRQYPGRPQQEKKVSGELFSLTYGAMVAQLVRDYESDEEINKQLDKILYCHHRLIQCEHLLYACLVSHASPSYSKMVWGYNIGVRLIEDFLARTQQARCYDLKETADVLAKVGFKTFLGVIPTVANWNQTNDEFSLILDQNPLTDFVELPEDHPNLLYSNILCGVIRGALEMVQLEVDVKFIQDQLKGDDTTEIRVKFIKKLEDAVPAGDD